MRRLALFLMAAMLVVLAARVEAGVTKRVRFQPGTSGATIRGAVIRGERDRYILGARSGQIMTVGVKALESNASFVVYPADSDAPVSPYDVKYWKGRLPRSCDYVIEVGPTRGNATYTLVVSIR